MDAVTIMTAVNNLNMVNTLNMLAVQNEDAFIVTENGKECEIMSGSILDAYIGKDCVVSLFNDVGGIKGKLMDADADYNEIMNSDLSDGSIILMHDIHEPSVKCATEKLIPELVNEGYKLVTVSELAAAKDVTLQSASYSDFWDSSLQAGRVAGYAGNSDASSDGSDSSEDSSAADGADVSDGSDGSSDSSSDGSGDGSDGYSDGSSDGSDYSDGSEDGSYDDGSEEY